MGPIFAQIGNAAAQAVKQFANSAGGKYVLHRVITTVTKKL